MHQISCLLVYVQLDMYRYCPDTFIACVKSNCLHHIVACDRAPLVWTSRHIEPDLCSLYTLCLIFFFVLIFIIFIWCMNLYSRPFSVTNLILIHFINEWSNIFQRFFFTSLYIANMKVINFVASDKMNVNSTSGNLFGYLRYMLDGLICIEFMR